MDLKAWHNLPEAAKIAAIEWHVRLTSGTASDADYAAFGDWTASDPAHMAALSYVESHAGRLEELRHDKLSSLDHLIEINRPAVPAPAIPANENRWRWPSYAALAATLMIGFIGVGIWLSPPFSRPEVARYASDNALERVTLSDGTIVTLAPGARMETSLAKRSRKVTAFEGVGYFHVADDKARPFTIAFGDQTITVVGTQFEVNNTESSRSVSVAEGVVAVAATVTGDEDAKHLVAGKRLSIAANAPEAVIDDIDPLTVSVWRDGMLEFDDAIVDDIITSLNALYGPETFATADSATSQLRFNGVLQLSDANSVARRLGEVLPIIVTQNDGHYVLSGVTPQQE